MDGNIFYSEVDKNLKAELNARGKAFRTRDENSLNFMLSKIANVEITAYATTSSKSNVAGVLGGTQVQHGRYLPTGPDGYLNSNRQYKRSELKFNDFRGTWYASESMHNDKSMRPGPYVTAVDCTIGDHSMGLLNKASLNIVIPNPERDLDAFEEVWMRPGRYAKIEIVHPTTAIAAPVETNGGLLTPLVIPNKEKLKQLYPDWDLNELERIIREMRKFIFEGLIVSFNLSYTKDGTVEVSLNLTGTSNIYTNISMYINDELNKKQNTSSNPATAAIIPTGSADFYGLLYDRFETIIADFKAADPAATKLTKFLLPYRAELPAPFVTTNNYSTDRFILKGEQFPASMTELGASFPDATLSNDARYITLGALIDHINAYVLNKLPGAQIICTDVECFSVYYPLMVSSNPNSILFLPKTTNLSYPFPSDYHVYGDLIYYHDVVSQLYANSINTEELKQRGLWQEWPGIYERNADNTGKVFPSRIFINLETIETLINNMSQRNSIAFSVDTFLKNICTLISEASGNAINLTLVTYPYDMTKLYLTDSKFVRVPADTKNVVAYSVPMFANHEHGTIVHDFQFQSQLPESAKNLSYVLNSTSVVSEEDIAPYMNFMYNAKNPAAINNILATYNAFHVTASANLAAAKSEYGLSPEVPAIQTKLVAALKRYIQYPTSDIKQTNLLAAPLFPFTVNFTIDGINGFRYGDVLTFDGLPAKYRINTVFSIIGISHTVSNQGEWKTQITCIQRPKIE